MRQRAAAIAFALGAVLPAAHALQQPKPIASQETVYINEQRVMTRGYAVGNVAIGDPAIADFKVLPGRREILLSGLGEGTTTLILWDQQNVKRDEVLIAVTTRAAASLKDELTKLLAGFTGVSVQTLAGALVLSGTVASESDRDAVAAIAEAAGIRSLVRFVPPPGAAAPAAAPDAPPDAPADPPAADPPVPAGPADAPARVALYEVELLEVSPQFVSGTYGTGIEPSGRPLYKGTVVMGPLAEGEVFIAGAKLFPNRPADAARKPGRPASSGPPPPLGIRLTLRPGPLDADGSFVTAITVETNLPYDSPLYDPDVQRRGRWEFTTGDGEPMGLAGADLLAVPELMDSRSALGRAADVAGAVGRLPGVSGLPGAQYTGSVVYYDREKKSQLLVLIRPRLRRE
jgi:hypothetical protein